MYSAVKRGGVILEFDIKKISEAILKASETLEAVFEEVEKEVTDAIDNIGRAMSISAHSLAHWLFHTFYQFTSRIRAAICFDPYSAVRLAILVKIRVKLLTAAFLMYARVQRIGNLLRTQDRSGEDNSDSDDIDSLSVVPA